MSESFDRLEELLVLRATEGLSDIENAELERQLAADSSIDEDAYDLAAAAVHLAFTDPEPMPATIRARIEAEAPTYVASEKVVPMRRLPTWLPIAAVLALAFVGWLTLRPAGEVSPSNERAALLAAASDLVTIDWTATDDPAAEGAQGDVVWSNEAQSGFMRFSGLAANDPAETQYQLWIFDAERDERYPVDGGVFDVPDSDGEVIVPIDPKVFVTRPVLFAVTVEKPGGVVVSDRERIVVVAQS